MARSSSPDDTGRPRWLRRLRRLAVLGALVGVIAAVRARMIETDQRQFDQRYRAGDPS